MKKTFSLQHEKIKPARLADKIKHEVKKYMKRESRRALPTGMDFWDFDCRFGANAKTAEVIHVSKINEYISQAEADELSEFYLEILSHAKKRHYTASESNEYDGLD